MNRVNPRLVGSIAAAIALTSCGSKALGAGTVNVQDSDQTEAFFGQRPSQSSQIHDASILTGTVDAIEELDGVVTAKLTVDGRDNPHDITFGTRTDIVVDGFNTTPSGNLIPTNGAVINLIVPNGSSQAKPGSVVVEGSKGEALISPTNVRRPEVLAFDTYVAELNACAARPLEAAPSNVCNVDGFIDAFGI